MPRDAATRFLNVDDAPHAASFRVSAPLLVRLARLGVQLELTVYPSAYERAQSRP